MAGMFQNDIGASNEDFELLRKLSGKQIDDLYREVIELIEPQSLKGYVTRPVQMCFVLLCISLS